MSDLGLYIKKILSLCFSLWFWIIPIFLLEVDSVLNFHFRWWQDLKGIFSKSKKLRKRIAKLILLGIFVWANYSVYHELLEDKQKAESEILSTRVADDKKYNNYKLESESKYNDLKKQFEIVKEDRAPKIDMIAMRESANSSSGVPDMIVTLLNKGKTTLFSENSTVSLGFFEFDKNDISWIPSKSMAPVYSGKPQNFNFDISQNKSVAEKSTYAVLKINSDQLSTNGFVAYIYYRWNFKGAYDGWVSLDSYYGNTDSAKDMVISLIKKQGGRVHK